MNSNYKPNSHRSKQNKDDDIRKIDKVVSGKVVRKKNNVRKVTNNILAEDFNEVKSYVFSDVLIPAAKKLISDVITNGVNMLLYGGESPKSYRSSGGSYIRHLDYSGRYQQTRPERNRRVSIVYSNDDVIVETRAEAEEVLRSLDDIIDTYGIARIADLYDLVGMSHNYTDNNYGWKNIANAEPIRVRTEDGYGYMIKMPRAIPID